MLIYSIPETGIGDTDKGSKDIRNEDSLISVASVFYDFMRDNVIGVTISALIVSKFFLNFS